VTFFFDARFIRVGHHDGISRFTANLCTELSKIRQLTAIISDPRQLENLPTGIDHIIECEPTSIKELGLARRLNRRGATLVYSPMQTTGSLGKKFKLVLTLHDLIYYRHPKPPSEFSFAVRALWRVYHWSFLPARMLLAGADGLVTISHTSLNLIRKANLFKGEIGVTFNAAEADYHRNLPRRAKADSNRLIYMGSFMDYKNVETLISGVGLLPAYELHLLSKISNAKRSELQALAAQKGAKLVFHNGVSDQQYLDLLDGAFALVSASRDEGFGIPLIESMSRATPVVCSDIAIFREVGATGATFFEPDSADSFAAGVLQLAGEWKAKSDLALQNAARFDWNTSATALNDYLKKFESVVLKAS
jgi:glycosyltransferase involved in cell wall biosynthesis